MNSIKVTLRVYLIFIGYPAYSDMYVVEHIFDDNIFMVLSLCISSIFKRMILILKRH